MDYVFLFFFSLDENSGRMDPGENISCDGDSVAVLTLFILITARTVILVAFLYCGGGNTAHQLGFEGFLSFFFIIIIGFRFLFFFLRYGLFFLSFFS